jgi:integrase
MPRRQVKRGGFTTKAAAQETMSRLQQERADGRYVEPTKVTLGTYLDMWLEGLFAREEVRANTRDEWSGHVRTHLKPRLGSVRLQQLV